MRITLPFIDVTQFIYLICMRRKMVKGSCEAFNYKYRSKTPKSITLFRFTMITVRPFETHINYLNVNMSTFSFLNFWGLGVFGFSRITFLITAHFSQSILIRYLRSSNAVMMVKSGC